MSGVHGLEHIERFTAAELPPSADAQNRYSVELKKSGKTLSVEPGLSLLDVLLEAGCDIDHSCREGVCGSCETRVLEGEVDHRDYFLSDSEKASNKVIQICISRAKTPRLVLDL